MTPIDSSFLSYDRMQQLFSDTSPEQIKKTLTSLSKEQLLEGVKTLQTEKHDSLLLKIVEHAVEYSQLESIGQAMSVQQFLHILSNVQNKPALIDKLNPLLVGLPADIFYQALHQAEKNHIDALKQEGILEPLEHHLNMFSHTCMHQLKLYQEESFLIQNGIKNIDMELLTSASLRDLRQRIEQLNRHYQSLLNAIEQALAIAWNTHRIDLIEELSQAKEFIHFQMIYHNESEHMPRQTLELDEELNQTLFKLYTPNKIQDEAPSVEGLAQLSIWYLKDYWELGLLPEVKNKEELELNGSGQHPKETLQHKQYLFDQVQDNLTRLGLATVADLKKAEIFSKNILREYIQAHSALLVRPIY